MFATSPVDRVSIPGRAHYKDSKSGTWCCLAQHSRIIRYVSRVKWSNPEKGVAPFPILRCSSYSKGSLWVSVDYSWISFDLKKVSDCCMAILFLFGLGMFSSSSCYSIFFTGHSVIFTGMNNKHRVFLSCGHGYLYWFRRLSHYISDS